jgi:hypothetical protein
MLYRIKFDRETIVKAAFDITREKRLCQHNHAQRSEMSS